MVSATGAEWAIAPEVPVTITVTVLPADELELEPQPAINNRPTASAHTKPDQRTTFQLLVIGWCFRLRRPNTIPKGANAENGNQPITPAMTYPPGGAIGDVVSIKVELTALDPGAIVMGEKAHVTPV
jgi:hypothetical protein